MDYHERALRLKQETGNKQEEASAYKKLGYAHHSLGDYQRAVDYHERELKLNRETRLVSIFINRKYVSFLYIKRFITCYSVICLLQKNKHTCQKNLSPVFQSDKSRSECDLNLFLMRLLFST